MMTIALDAPVSIPTGNSLVVGYRVKYAKDKFAITLDAGPGVTGGGMLSFDGTNWYAVSKIDNTFNNNVIVNASVQLKGSSTTRTLSKQATPSNIDKLRTIGDSDINQLKESMTYGANQAVTRAEDGKPTVQSYRLYCNDKLVQEGAEKEYNTTLGYASYHTYTVTAIYSNGWESAKSEPFSVSYQQPNLSVAPYGLSGTLENGNLTLMWQSPETANELNYQDKTSGSLGVGLTKTSGIEGYYLISYLADELEGKAGEYITHIKFGLYTPEVTSAAVVVFLDRNLVFKQNVDVATLAKGENTVRLDAPFEVPVGREIHVGYYLTHANGVKPNLIDEGPAIDERGNWIYTGSWRTLKSMSAALDYNWRISAVLQQADKALKAATRSDDAPSVSYSVYRDGILISENIAATNTVISNAAKGNYTVVAVKEGVQSSPSNMVMLGDTNPTGMMDVTENAPASYDQATQEITVSEMAVISLFAGNGSLIKQVKANKLSILDLPNAIYIVKIETESGNQQLMKIAK